jgi:hypothetical protein
MTDMGSLHLFLGIVVTHDSFDMHLSQAKYAVEILDKGDMTACKYAMTPVDTSPKLAVSTDPLVANPTEYRSLPGLSSTSPSRALTLPMPFSRCAFTCMIRTSSPWRLLSAS